MYCLCESVYKTQVCSIKTTFLFPSWILFKHDVSSPELGSTVEMTLVKSLHKCINFLIIFCAYRNGITLCLKFSNCLSFRSIFKNKSVAIFRAVRLYLNFWLLNKRKATHPCHSPSHLYCKCLTLKVCHFKTTDR